MESLALGSAVAALDDDGQRILAVFHSGEMLAAAFVADAELSVGQVEAQLCPSILLERSLTKVVSTGCRDERLRSTRFAQIRASPYVDSSFRDAPRCRFSTKFAK